MIFWLVLKLEISCRVIISWRILVFLEDLFEDHIFCMVKYLSFSIILHLPYDPFQCKWQGHTGTHPLVFLFCHIEISNRTVSGGLLRSLIMVLRKQWYITIIHSQFIWKMENNRQRTSSSLLVLHETRQFLEVSWTNQKLWFFHVNFFFKYPELAVLNKINRTAQNWYKPRAASCCFLFNLQWVFLGQNAFSSSTSEWNKLIAYQMGWSGLSGEKKLWFFRFSCT